MQQAYEISVPGSIMLLGEHAVLSGYRGLACAVNQWIHAKLTPSANKSITIVSDKLGTFRTDLDNLSVTAPFQFVLTAIQHHRKLLPHGFTLEINSNLPHQMGLGSSAAVTVATIALLKNWLEPSVVVKSTPFFHACLAVVHEVQHGLGSGADLAASIWGGIVSIKLKPFAIEKLATNLVPIVLIYSGNKTPTMTVIQMVLKLKEKYPNLVESILHAIGECSEMAYEALLQHNWKKVAELFMIQQPLLKALMLSTPLIDKIINHLESDPGIVASKISGSGLGDCIVGLGQLTVPTFWEDSFWKERNVFPIAIEMSEQGAAYGNK